MYTSTPADVPDLPFRFFECLVPRLLGTNHGLFKAKTSSHYVHSTLPVIPPARRDYLFGRLSFHPIPCGSRDRPAGRKVIGTLHLDEGQSVLDTRTCILKAGGVYAPPQVRKLYIYDRYVLLYV